MKKNRLSVSFLGKTFQNPIILPSGIIQEIPDHIRAEKDGVGGITLKSLTKEKREGNPLPRVVKFSSGFVNSVGLRNPGIKKGVQLVKHFVRKAKIPVIASIFAVTINDFVYLAREIEKVSPFAIELNLSCPNTLGEFGKPLGYGVETTYQAVHAVRTHINPLTKIIAKLSPNVDSIAEVAKSAEEAGADAISAINTVGPGMIIDIQTKKPVLGNKTGGVSGPAILPIALRCVYEIYENISIPIIGIGGISSWQDAVQMILAGATLIGVGSAVYTNRSVYQDISQGISFYLKKQNVTYSQLIGSAHV